MTSTKKEIELEKAFLKVPFEQLNKEFRSSQKSVEKDLSVIEKAVKEIAQKVTKQKVSLEDQCKYLDKVVNKLRGVKRKLEETDVSESVQLNICKLRIDHLSEYPIIQGAVSRRKSHANITEEEYVILKKWRKIRVNRVIVDYLLRFGYFQTAIELAEHENIKEFVDIQLFTQSKQVIEGLENKDCTEALKWCSDNKSRLKKINSSFEFNIRLQEFLELVRNDKKMDAIAYARKFLTKQEELNKTEQQQEGSNCIQNEEQMQLVKKSMGALVFGPQTSIQPYKDLFKEERWDELIEQFKQDNYRLYGLTIEPILFIVLRCGLSALKIPLDENTFNINDPLCNEKFQQLSEELPYSHHHHSKLVCRVTGQIMDDKNPAMILPNGNVYSLKGLEELVKRNKGIIIDPRGGEKYTLNDAKKLFIMN
ncbi:hypothetical protein ABK040_000604 [Willaertia magna]